MIVCIHLYQYFISPWLGNNCRFYPSCSKYSYKAVSRYGLIHGGWLSLCRLAKCHPWHEGGYDPLPSKDRAKIPTR